MTAANILTEHQNGQLAHLIAHTGVVKGAYELRDFTVIGRDRASQIELDDENVEKRHARIEIRQDGYYLRDLRSTSGTFLNGTQIIEAKLKNFDRIRIGLTDFIFSYDKNLDDNAQFLTSKNVFWDSQLKRIPFLAQSALPVLICGPSGSGKELIANLIHKFSLRASAPFLSVNCSALTENLAESELFGHRKGSFTGSQEARKGAFASCHGGTLFLDEIGDMPLNIQPKFLRALENNEIKAVGSDHTEKTDVRIIAATNRNLAELVAKGQFREDLYYRIHILQIRTPTLAERFEDFDDLVNFFARPQRVRFSSEALALLREHSWPGNIRELKNTILRASAIFPDRAVHKSDMKEILDIREMACPTVGVTASPLVTKEQFCKYEKEYILEKLSLFAGNQRKTADAMGIAKSTLHDRIKRYGINPHIFKKMGPPQTEIESSAKTVSPPT